MELSTDRRLRFRPDRRQLHARAVRPIPQDFPRTPVRTGDAESLGVTPTMLLGKRFQRIMHGSYLRSDADAGSDVLVQALRRLHPAAVLSCLDAAVLYDVPLDAGPAPHVSAPDQIRRAGVRAHRRQNVQTTVHRGVPVTTRAQTFLDLAAELDDVTLIIVGDGLCRRPPTTPGGLAAFLATAGPVRGLSRARRAVARVRAGVESQWETRVRLIIVAAGLPEPLVNDPAKDPYGGWLATIDLIYPHLKIAIEYQGDHHRTSRSQWRRDIKRARTLQAEGWILLYLTADDVRYPNRFLGHLRQALAERGAL